jgi:hypothetical protein
MVGGLGAAPKVEERRRAKAGGADTLKNAQIFEIFHPDTSVRAFGKRYFPKDIPGLIRKHKCCDLMFLSHQGDGQNPGGVSFLDPDTDPDTYIPVLPGPSVVTVDGEINMRVGRIEDEIRSALKANQCKTCNTFLYTCGRPGANGFADNRQKIADRIGCDVYGTRQTIFQVFRNKKLWPVPG